MLKTLTLTSLLVAAGAACAAEEGFHVYEYPGYVGLDRIPGTAYTVHQKDRPQPRRVIPGAVADCRVAAPSDAEVLFDGGSLERFRDNAWVVVDGVLRATRGGLVTKNSYGDCQLHVEWRTPNPPSGSPANMGNSGIFLMGLYELQIYDSYSSKIYADGSAAAIYGQTPPLVNACRKPGEWQSYDVIFRAPVFRDGRLVEPARITVLHNGVLVHLDTEILGPTTHRKFTPYRPHPARLPIVFQAHKSPVEFRNIWVRDLDEADGEAGEMSGYEATAAGDGPA